MQERNLRVRNKDQRFFLIKRNVLVISREINENSQKNLHENCKGFFNLILQLKIF